MQPASRVREAGFLFELKTESLNVSQAVAQLCPNCGLCCNGVLFDDVELQKGDDLRKLEAAGLEFFPKGRKTAFAQPCACFDGKLCRIYADRPKRCAAFDCRLLQRVQDGELTAAEALKQIRITKRQADKVAGLVRDLGRQDETQSLSKRYRAVLAEGIDLSAKAADIKRRGDLMRAVGKLAGQLERDFLK
jgi:hypothetical protein